MFKRAYVHGVTRALIDAGAVKFANDEEAAAAADTVAEQLPEQPVGEVPPEATAELAANLVDLATSLQASADSAAAAADAAGGDTGEKTSALKRAAAFVRAKLSRKTAADTGATIVGDRPAQENSAPNATNSEVKLDEKNRPGGDAYANVGEDGVGTQSQSGAGAIASEKKVEGTGAGPAVSGSNSATEAVKGASLRAFIKKIAQGSTITGDQNFPNAPTGELAMDTTARPEGYANVGEDGVGQSAMADQIAASAVGTEQPHPGQQDNAGGSNTVIEQSEKAAQDEYLQRFKMTGHKYASALPFYLTEEEKVAAIQYLMSVPPDAQTRIVREIQKTAEMPAGLKAYIEAKKGEGEGEGESAEHEKGETKEEEKKEEEKKDEEKKGAAKTAAVRKPRQDSVIARLRSLQGR